MNGTVSGSHRGSGIALRTRRVTRHSVFAALAVLALASVSYSHDDPASDGLIDGGGNVKTDCVSKFQTGVELNYPPVPKKSKELRCMDGDLACDADGAVNGSCTINVGLCLADDEEVTTCMPAGVMPGGVAIKNKPLGHRKHDPQIQALQDAADTLLGASGVPCDDPGAGGGNCFQCTTSRVGIVASLADKKGKKKIKVKVVTEPAPPRNKPIKDTDKLKMRCVECTAQSAFAHIADIVFKQSCAFSACHTGPVPAAGLNLDVDDIGLTGVYDEVVNEAPSSPGATATGMSRVLPGDPNLGTPGSASLIYEKLVLTNNELDAVCTAAGQVAGCLGQNMPPGTDTFSTGKLNLLQAWIEAGAPIDGWMAGATCGEPEDVWNPAAPPTAPDPSEGFQIHMPAPDGFFVEPGTEFEGCQWLGIPDTVTGTWYIDRIEIVANTGTHHIILWETQDPTAGNETPFDPNDSLCSVHGREFGLANGFRIGAQDPVTVLLLPQNTSYTMESTKVFGFNMHYTNPFNVPIYPEIWVNFYGSTTPTPVEAEQIFPGDLGFAIPPGTIGTGNLGKWTNNTGVGQCFYSLSAHQHRRGTGFKIWTSQPSDWNDGTDRIYYNTDWDHADVLTPNPSMLIPPGGGIWFQCEFDNGVLADVTKRCQLGAEGSGPGQCGITNEYMCFSDEDCPPGETTGLCRECNCDFGFLAEDEMCFMFGQHYQAQPGPDPCPW